MNRKILFWGFVAVLVTGCVEHYTPEIKESQESLVVEGMLTDQSGLQTIYLSRSSPFNEPGFIPESNCTVNVRDENGNSYRFFEQGDGIYSCWMSESQLVRGTAYKLNIVTEEGKEYESEYDILSSPCPSIDSIYYEKKTVGTSDPELNLEGVQFYIDLEAGEDDSRNYRWEVVETWEYFAAHIIQYYFDGIELHIMDDPFKYYRCWYTGKIVNIFIFSTKNSVSNRIYKYPLHYVSSQTNRLRVKYSILIRQFSLSDNAYKYWDQIRKQQQESGGLYETQPSQIRGNIYNANEPDEQVLGFFNVASISEKRIFVDIGREFRFDRIDCTLDTINTMDEIPPPVYFPVYMISLNPMGTGPPYGVGWGICFDCMSEGGTNVKPYFWE